MKKSSEFFEVAKGFTDIAHLGLSVISPIALCGGSVYLLNKKFSLPEWVQVSIILLGVFSGIYSSVAYIKSYLKRIEMQEKKRKEEDPYNLNK